MTKSEHLPAAFWVPIDELTPWDKNPRDNDGKPVAKVAKSIREFGFVAPICVWKSASRMVAGHTRLKAMRALLADDASFVPRGAPGPGLVPVRFHEFTDEAEADAYAIADNRLNEEAGWQDEQLKENLAAIRAKSERSEQLVEATGFERREILKLLPDAPPPGKDEVPDPPKAPITRLGDVWRLGRHRLACGDSTSSAAVALACDAGAADMVWTDPPYGVEYVGKTKDALKIQNDELQGDELEDFLVRAFRAADVALCAGGAIYVAHPAGPRSLAFLKAFVAVPWRLHQTLAWLKDSMVLGRTDYHYIHEPILFGYKPGKGRRGRGPGATGWYGDNAQVSVFEVARPKASREHPTMKPPELVAKAIENSAPRDGLVLDPFGGSGSTLVACETTGRRCATVELDPKYCDVIVERWQRLTGQKAKRIPAKAA